MFSRKIVVAIDPREDFTSTKRTVTRAIEDLLGYKQKGEVHLVHVMSQALYAQSAIIQGLPWQKKYIDAVEIRLEHFSRILEKKFKSLTIYSKVTGDHLCSLLESIHLLCDYVKNNKADCIVTGTHGRRGLRRWVTGSFTESLLLHSSIPVWVNQVEKRIHRHSKSIAVPTDFTKQSLGSFERALKFCKEKQLDIELFHYMELPYLAGDYMGWDSPMFDPAGLNSMSKDQKAREKNLSKDWYALAKKYAVSVKLTTQTGTDGTANSILKHAKKKHASLIIMSTTCKRRKTFFEGSVTRQVVRRTACPVLVFRQEDAKIPRDRRRSSLKKSK